MLLAGCLGSIALGYAAMLWLTRLPGDRRVLDDASGVPGAGWGGLRAGISTGAAGAAGGATEVGR